MNKTSYLASEKGVYSTALPLDDQFLASRDGKTDKATLSALSTNQHVDCDDRKEKSSGFFDKFMHAKKVIPKNKSSSSSSPSYGASFDSDNNGTQRLTSPTEHSENSLNSAWQNIDLIDADVEEQKQKARKLQDCVESTKMNVKNEVTTSIPNSSDKVSGSFLNRFKNAKLKSKKENSSKESSDDKEKRILTDKFLQDTKKFSDSLEEKQYEPSEKQVVSETRKIDENPMEVKFEVLNNVENSVEFGNTPNSIEKQICNEKFRYVGSSDQDLRMMTLSFLEDSRNAAGIIDACPYKSAYLYKKSPLRIEEDEKADDDIITESVDREEVNRKKNTIKSTSSTKKADNDNDINVKAKGKKSNNFLSSLFKGAKQASQDVAEDVKDFVDETRKEAIEEEKRAREQVPKKTAVKETLNSEDKKVKNLKNNDVTTTSFDAELKATKGVPENNTKYGEEVEQEKKGTKIKELAKSNDSAVSGTKSGVDKVKGKSGLLTDILKSVKNVADDVSEEVKDFVDETRNEAVMEEKKLASTIGEIKSSTNDKKSATKMSTVKSSTHDTVPERSEKEVKLILKVPKIVEEVENGENLIRSQGVKSQDVADNAEKIDSVRKPIVSSQPMSKCVDDDSSDESLNKKMKGKVEGIFKYSLFKSSRQSFDRAQDVIDEKNQNTKKKDEKQGKFDPALVNDKLRTKVADEEFSNVESEAAALSMQSSEFLIRKERENNAMEDVTATSPIHERKEKAGGYLLAMFKNTKQSATEIMDDVANFAEETRREAREEEEEIEKSATKLKATAKDRFETKKEQVDEVQSKITDQEGKPDAIGGTNNCEDEAVIKTELQCSEQDKKKVGSKHKVGNFLSGIFGGQRFHQKEEVEEAETSSESEKKERAKKCNDSKENIKTPLARVIQDRDNNGDGDVGDEDERTNSRMVENNVNASERIVKKSGGSRKHRNADEDLRTVADSAVSAVASVKKRGKEKTNNFFLGVFDDLKHTGKEAATAAETELESSKKQVALKWSEKKEKNVKEKSTPHRGDKSEVSTDNNVRDNDANDGDNDDEDDGGIEQIIMTNVRKIDSGANEVAKQTEDDLRSIDQEACACTEMEAADVRAKSAQGIGKVADSTFSLLKKEKDRGTGLFSGIFKSAKNASKDVTKEVREFADETKQEALDEEKKSKEIAVKLIDDFELTKNQTTDNIKTAVDQASRSIVVEEYTETRREPKNLVDENVKMRNTDHIVEVSDELNKSKEKLIDKSTAEEQMKQETKQISVPASQSVKVQSKVRNDESIGDAEKDIKQLENVNETTTDTDVSEERKSGFFSGILRGAKNTMIKSSAEIKDFVEDTKQEAIEEENFMKARLAHGNEADVAISSSSIKRATVPTLTIIEKESNVTEENINQDLNNCTDLSASSNMKKEKKAKRADGFLSNIFKGAKHDAENNKVKEAVNANTKRIQENNSNGKNDSLNLEKASQTDNSNHAKNQSARDSSDEQEKKLHLEAQDDKTTYHELPDKSDKPDNSSSSTGVRNQSEVKSVTNSTEQIAEEERDSKSEQLRKNMKRENTKSDRNVFRIWRSPKNAKKETIAEASSIANELKEDEEKFEMVGKSWEDGRSARTAAAENRESNRFDGVTVERKAKLSLVDESEGERIGNSDEVNDDEVVVAAAAAASASSLTKKRKKTNKAEDDVVHIKEGKERTNNFLSSMIGSAKSAKEKIVDEVKEFAEITKRIDSEVEEKKGEARKQTSEQFVAAYDDTRAIDVLEPMNAMSVTSIFLEDMRIMSSAIPENKNDVFATSGSSNFEKKQQRQEEKEAAPQMEKKKRDKTSKKEGGGILSGIVKKTKDVTHKVIQEMDHAAGGLKGATEKFWDDTKREAKDCRLTGSYDVNPPRASDSNSVAVKASSTLTHDADEDADPSLEIAGSASRSLGNFSSTSSPAQSRDSRARQTLVTARVLTTPPPSPATAGFTDSSGQGIT